jgi:hypothetical protein
MKSLVQVIYVKKMQEEKKEKKERKVSCYLPCLSSWLNTGNNSSTKLLMRTPWDKGPSALGAAATEQHRSS